MKNFTVNIVNYASRKLIRQQVIQAESIQDAMNSASLNLNRWEAVGGATETPAPQNTPHIATSLGGGW